jgi:GNAT superfamily N-acetyltransferase
MAPEAQERLPITVRQATIDDAERLSELSTQLGYPASRKDVERRLKLIARSPENVVYVAALADRRVVGWLHAYVRRLVESDPTADIGGLVVDEGCRRSGAGRLLMQHAEQWARERGCKAVTLRSNVLREAAHGFYQSLGYTIVKTQHAYRKVL